VGISIHKVVAWLLNDEKSRGFANVAQRFVIDLADEYIFGRLERYKLPYPDCLVLVNGGHGTQMVYCVSEDTRGIWGGVSIYMDGRCWGLVPIHLAGDGHSFAWFPEDVKAELPADLQESNAWVVGPLIRFLDVLASTSTSIRASDPGPVVNAKRERKGKSPLVEYRTVVIGKDDGVLSGPSGGHHASPKLHLRRGHWRALLKKTVWIKPAVVGDKSRGLVLKDYEVRSGEQRTH
jgi:hypothetical protein